MKTKAFVAATVWVAAMLLTVFTACNEEYDDSGLTNRLDKLENRLVKLEEFCQQMNTNISALQTLVEAMETGDYITGITPIVKEGKEVGYTLTFAKSKPITIYHGKQGADGEDGADGADGTAPVIGVKKDTDNRYYWTVNGQWLLDAEGKKVCANGANGEPGEPGKPGPQGAPGITPKLKIENNHWWVSYDEGKSWTDLGKAVAEGEGGVPADAIFDRVTVNEGEVVFDLLSGESFALPLHRKVEIRFETQEQGIQAGATIRIPYTLTNATDRTTVTASSDGNYRVKIEEASKNGGTLVVMAPQEYTDGYINVLVNDGAYSSLEVIRFYQWEVSVSGQSQNTNPTYLINSSGKNIEVPVAVNFDYKVEIPAEAQSWVSVQVMSLKQVVRKEKIVFDVKPNTGSAARSCRVRMVPAHSEESVVEFVIEQASVQFSINQSNLVFDAQAGSKTSTFRCTSKVKVVMKKEVPWIHYELNQKREDEYELLLRADTNAEDQVRQAEIQIYTFDGQTLLATLSLMQLPRPSDSKDDFVLQVSANVANDFTVVLPLNGQMDCVVDWGDGTREPFLGSRPKVSHTYQGLNKPTDFTVRISGRVSRLEHDYPSQEGMAHSITGIVQWGNIHLNSISGEVFEAYANIKHLPGDTRGAFAEATSLAFGNMKNLESIDPDLLAYAQQCTNLYGLFANCKKLSSIPEGLFRNCHQVTNLGSVFDGCESLTSIPAQLFAGCQQVTYMRYAFSGCKSLTRIPADLFKHQTAVTDFSSAFSACKQLSEIPEGLFDACSQATDFSNLFFGCEQLKSIPARLFANCTEATTYAGAFGGCKNLQAIPEGLLDAGTKITSISRLFFGCEQITSIPENLLANCRSLSDCEGTFNRCNLQSIPEKLLANCPELNDISSMFAYNQQLKAIPNALFENCVKLTEARMAFGNCVSLTGESPFNWLDGKKVHLYERKDYPLHFKEISLFRIFSKCTNLDDYDVMPAECKRQ